MRTVTAALFAFTSFFLVQAPLASWSFHAIGLPWLPSVLAGYALSSLWFCATCLAVITLPMPDLVRRTGRFLLGGRR